MYTDIWKTMLTWANYKQEKLIWEAWPHREALEIVVRWVRRYGEDVLKQAEYA